MGLRRRWGTLWSVAGLVWQGNDEVQGREAEYLCWAHEGQARDQGTTKCAGLGAPALAAWGGSGAVGVAAATDEVDDQPDQADEDEQGGEENGEGETAREHGLRAVDGGGVGDLGGGGEGGKVAVDGGVFVEAKSSEEEGDIAADGTAGLDVDGAEENGDVAADVALGTAIAEAGMRRRAECDEQHGQEQEVSRHGGDSSG